MSNPEQSADVSHANIDDLEVVEEFLEGFAFRAVGAQLKVKPFGLSVIDLPAGSTDYPAHDHVSEGPGNPPAHQLGQEEVYMALRGSGEVEVDGERLPLEVGDVVRVGPSVRRKILSGSEGLRLLAIGGYPGQVYESARATR